MSRLNDYLSESVTFLKNAQAKEYIKYTKADEIQENIEKCMKNVSQTDRRIKVAIAGKMNTGKSMLVDNLFFEGRGVVNSFELPSTARLSILFYSEREYAVVTFISEEDVENLKKMAGRYEKDEDSSYRTAYELYNAIENSNIDYHAILREGKKEIPLSGLGEYSDAQGKYTVFVKTIDIYINHPVLKDIEIIDTPGLGDPVVSREEITNEKMNDVDLVIYLSYTGMFMDDNDINYYLFLRKKGINNVIILASRFDEKLNSKDYPEKDPMESRTFLAIKDDFLKRYEQYDINKQYMPTDIYPSMPLLAKLYYILRRGEALTEILDFYKKKTEKKLQLNLACDPILDISGIEHINKKLKEIASDKENQLFISNKNAVLSCFKQILGSYDNQLLYFKKEQAQIEIAMDDPRLLEKIKNEIKYFAIEFDNAILDSKNYAVHELIQPKCEAFKRSYKGLIETLKSSIDGYFQWLHNHEKEPGTVTRNIRNSFDIYRTNIIELFDLSLSETFGIGENENLYRSMLSDLKKRLDPIKIKSLDMGVKGIESLNRIMQLLKETIYSQYIDLISNKIGSGIIELLSMESIKTSLKECSQDISNLADNIEKEAGWRDGLREERRNNNSRIKLDINSTIDEMKTNVVAIIDRLGNTGLNENFDQIRLALKSVVGGYEQNLYAEYSNLGTEALSEKLARVNRDIAQIEGSIREIKEVCKEIEELAAN